ncbi:MAG: SDR family oxidoreductase, partial [Caldilineaceae bacterium]
MDHPLAGKVVIITGASSGIGEATARALAPLGCKLTLAARSVDRLEALAGELVADTLVLPGDITNGDYVISMVDSTLERFGRLDVLFANAGIYIPGEAAEGNPDDWAQLMDVNINGVLRSTHAALGPMIKQGSGDILVTSSISGFIDIHWEPIYSASKHAIQA